MWIFLYWAIKILSWVGLIFSLFSIVKPQLMLKCILLAIQWNLILLGLQGEIKPKESALTITRIWSAVLAFLFALLIYIFTYVIMIAYEMK